MIAYENNILMCENVDIREIAEIYGTPFYIYSKNDILNKIRFLKEVFSPLNDVLIVYAIKAENNLSILKMMAEEGIGADVVSIGETLKYIKAGGKAENVVFSGVAKTEEEIRKSIELNIKRFNIESIPEAIRINNIAKELKNKVKCSIRVNPNVDAHTHEKITTGVNGNKFGISIKTIRENSELLKSLSNIEIESLSMHIGSQMTDAEPFYKAILVMRDLIGEINSMGFNITDIDIGGGYGVRYNRDHSGFDFNKFKAESINLLKEMNLRVTTEPGRYFVAESGALIMRVEYIKEELGRKYVILNGGMNDYVRVAMYDAYNEIYPLVKKDNVSNYDFVGPICESSDFFAYDRESSVLEQGDYVALLDAGAYGFSMSSNYNSRLFIPQVMIDDKKHYIIRKRQTFEDMIRDEIL
ncbi:diaminopimelate decarboxylase [Brachyspira hyodysenteriae]|uniref:Diaminopimelate decarboxylase n=1 Tax=Brachyspira hyodysenteriae (strain ATCC 49526 / WA1) TaxID=565034 RepID=A0A3B6VEZ7_BRAHW|nr:diaminopimelate decarboxylase [Brachyspira hyodysenteriae]ACN83424.1 diaminopimelate decarboxylase [Brachyspira hyodysenteriae WA1]AUJ49162.1 diaminopimelate decarboxylase [Brachyspira hyodysenteriae]KLI14696.1 diaminopimelate decarboxylase [Brachyspira hyodysenteriae]KLI18237.1 diaminopimelate decarboxylase [Brachyspira hyodysenteriae]KLI20468.1 diaminopimelate decarboxylase [Brachyspira hyodysenteriae]